jgi:hypothetical protein
MAHAPAVLRAKPIATRKAAVVRRVRLTVKRVAVARLARPTERRAVLNLLVLPTARKVAVIHRVLLTERTVVRRRRGVPAMAIAMPARVGPVPIVHLPGRPTATSPGRASGVRRAIGADPLPGHPDW